MRVGETRVLVQLQEEYLFVSFLFFSSLDSLVFRFKEDWEVSG